MAVGTIGAFCVGALIGFMIASIAYGICQCLGKEEPKIERDEP